MPKKSKGRKKVRKTKRPRGAKGGMIPLTNQQQFTPIHNQALKNKARDDAAETRAAQGAEKEFKMDTLKLQRAYVEKKLSLLV